MSTSIPDPTAMERYCERVLRKVLHEACELQEAVAEEVSRDVLLRAKSFASLSPDDQFVLSAPFFEESLHHEPADCRPELRAAVTVVVRNSRLEQVHAGGLVHGDVVHLLTKEAAKPLSHLLGTALRSPMTVPENQLSWIKSAYPRAWDCLTALGQALETGTRVSYRMPDAPLPQLPLASERVEARASSDGQGVVLGGLDLRYDDQLYAQMEAATEGALVAYVPSLSRFSRDSGKLHRVLEFFLAHDAAVLTTNYLLRTRDVLIRDGLAVEPSSRDYWRGVRDQRGLRGVHRQIARTLAQQVIE